MKVLCNLSADVDDDLVDLYADVDDGLIDLSIDVDECSVDISAHVHVHDLVDRICRCRLSFR